MTNTDKYIRWILNLNLKGKFAFSIITIMFSIALLAPFLANNRPIICSINNEICSPVLLQIKEKLINNKLIDNENWMNKSYNWSLFPPITYLPDEQNLSYKFLKPNTFGNKSKNYKKHYFGTETLGRDIAASTIYGTKISLSIGILSAIIAFLLGSILGILSGFFGNNSYKLYLFNIYLIPIFLFFATFYLFQYLLKDFIIIPYLSSLTSFLLIQIILYIIYTFVSFFFIKNNFCTKKINFPFDFIILRIIELINALPKIILIISIMAILKPSFTLLVFILGFFSCTNITRLLRAEIIQIKSLSYINAAKISGYSTSQIIFKHVLPNAIQPVIVNLTFIVAQSILAESTLSFLGMGLSGDNAITWGYLLRIARENPSAWWIGIFPGLCLFLTIFSLNILGELFNDNFNKKTNY